MSAYSGFAAHYDNFTQNVDYARRADYILELAAKFGHTPRQVLDVACGTGSFTLEFAKRGLDVIGVDISADMLAVARARTDKSDILFLQQDMCQLDLYGTVDTAVCMLDGVNHIADEDDVDRFFGRMALFVEPGGLFIFDANTLYKHREILACNCFVYEHDTAVCIWRNNLLDDNATVEISLDIFEEADGVYRRYCEDFEQRAYTPEFFKQTLLKNGFDTLGVFDDLSMRELKDDSQRMIVVARKRPD